MAAGLAVVFFIGTLIPKVSYPPARFATLIVSASPGDLATAMIERFGHWALRSLSWGVNLAAAVLGGLAARWISIPEAAAAKARLAIIAGTSVLLVSIALSLTSPEGSSVMAVLAYVFGAYVFARGASPVPLASIVQPKVRDDETPADAIRRSRRRFLVRALSAVGGVLAGGVLVSRGRSELSDVGISIADVPFAMPPQDPVFPKVQGLSSEITPISDFYNVDINIVKPRVDHKSWKLEVGGLVDSPYELTYRQLQNQFDVVEMAHTLTCISNEVGGDLISTAVWRGVRLREVLERGGVRAGAVDIVFRGAEGYSDSITLDKAMEDTTLVVFGMNGRSLPREHGFPARIIVPGIYGMKNVKWLTKIEVVDHDYQGYWMVRGWSDVARIKTSSRIDVPGTATRVGLPTMIAGVAWAGDRGIRAVEVSQDGGKTWNPAILKREISERVWRLWATDLEPGGGKRRVLVRALDGEGETQSSEVTKPHPAGASGIHSVVLEIE